MQEAKSFSKISVFSTKEMKLGLEYWKHLCYTNQV